ncbi:MAG: hypothetical protein P4L10_04335, partial [Acidobacteriaceae bacterium]|nr:hypothetical protein [Acidobacteriaceae bacterium]
AICRRSREYVVDMTCSARQCGMHPCQRISGVFEMIEFRIKPAVHGVAAFASSWKSQSYVINDLRLKVLLVARVASRRETSELPAGRVLVALVAFHQGMGSDQRKTILMIANGIQRYMPAFHRMAALAVGAKLTAMYVRMAIGTMGTDILEYQLGVALHARNFLVHALQGISSLIVIEFRIRPDWFPTGIRVAVLAGYRNRAVRVGHIGLWTANLGPITSCWLLHSHADSQR